MSDLISRQAAIDAVNGVIADYIPNIYGRYEALPLEIASAVNRLPSAQQTVDAVPVEYLKRRPSAEPLRHGKWLWLDGVRCSECNYKLETTGLPSYCPNCGCRMDKE